MGIHGRSLRSPIPHERSATRSEGHQYASALSLSRLGRIAFIFADQIDRSPQNSRRQRTFPLDHFFFFAPFEFFDAAWLADAAADCAAFPCLGAMVETRAPVFCTLLPSQLARNTPLDVKRILPASPHRRRQWDSCPFMFRHLVCTYSTNTITVPGVHVETFFSKLFTLDGTSSAF